MPQLASQQIEELNQRVFALEARLEKLDPTPKEEPAEAIIEEEQNPVDKGKAKS